MLVNEEVSFDHNSPGYWAEDYASLANQGRGPWRWFAIRGNVLGTFY